MYFRPPSLTRIRQAGILGIFCLALVGSAVPLTGNEPFLNKPPEEWTEEEAVQVLNDSPWARPITTTTQDFQCNYEHPVFPGMYSEERARELDFIVPTSPAAEVKPDGAEYVVQFLSVKPMQAAIARLLALDEQKWKGYFGGTGLAPGSPPTNLEEHWYNLADELAVSIVLKKPGPGGASFRDYAFPRVDKEGHIASGSGPKYSPACGAVRTANGVGHWCASGPVAIDERRAQPTSITVFFASTANGKPLISHANEKVEFRYITDQRVFEATFYVSPKDLFDGTETTLRYAGAYAAPTP